MDEQRPDYLSYLLRLWRVRERGPPDGEPGLWRASLQIPESGERIGFRSLEELFAFLRRESGTAQDVEEAGG
jgi:hypothetical protein